MSALEQKRKARATLYYERKKKLLVRTWANYPTQSIPPPPPPSPPPFPLFVQRLKRQAEADCKARVQPINDQLTQFGLEV